MVPRYQVPIIELGKHFAFAKEELIEAFVAVGESGNYVLGEQLQEFEQEVAAYLGASHVLGVSNATEGLQLCFELLGINQRSRVIAPDNTFVGTFGAIRAVGATPYFCDIGQDFNLRVTAEDLYGMDAVVPVHLYGRPCDLDSLSELCRNSGSFLIEDAAQAFGAKYKGQLIGSSSDLAVFSLHPLKNLHIFGDGGLIVTSDTKKYEWLKQARNHGLLDRDSVGFPGRNARLDELQAAFGRVMLRHFSSFQARVKQIEQIFRAELNRFESILLPPEDDNDYSSNWHNFVIRLPGKDVRDELAKELLQKGIDSKVRYPFVVSSQSAYGDLGRRVASYKGSAELINETMLSIPIYFGMSDEQVQKVVTAFQCFFKKV